MLDLLWTRLKQGHRTMTYPDGPPPELPERFVGRPTIDQGRCAPGCRACAEACPTGAIALRPATTPRTPLASREDLSSPGNATSTSGASLLADHPNGTPQVHLDLGKCLFCRACQPACPAEAICFTRDYRLAASRRDDLIISGAEQLACSLNETARRLFGRSLRLRQVSAGGCNACEADTNVLGTLAWDIGRFGIQFVASPRHADGLLITGPVSQNMRLALEKTYQAVPSPKIVIAVGACATSGGPYAGHPETLDGASSLITVDLFVPGCPPHPLTILDALLGFLGQTAER